MRNIFVVGLDNFHLAQLQALPGASGLAFHPLFSHQALKQQASFPAARLLQEGRRRLRAFPGTVDAVVGYWDFPVSTALPLLRAAVGLPGPSLEAVLRCEHKYWSRRCQAEVIPEQVPALCVVDPFADDPLSQVSLGFPFWLKPVRSVLSHLGFRIENPADFHAAIAQVRAGIGRLAEPFNLFLQHAELPPDIAAVDGWHCIAEAIISNGLQCTQEGYAFGGEVVIYGTIDSLREGPAGSCFSRYQYPSSLPQTVQARMSDCSRRIIRHIGYDKAPFNIEYFWDPDTDRIWLLEINARLSKSHAPLFELVDGRSHFQVMLDLGLGHAPHPAHRSGPCAVAAKFMPRHFGDARVLRAPGPDDIAALEAQVPHCRIQVAVRAGMRLSELRNQDSYSYELASLFIGADNQAQLLERFADCMARLPLELAPIAAAEAAAAPQQNQRQPQQRRQAGDSEWT
ncbi:D-alanine--D-alanine ligase [Thiohalocapsa marina]|uniref:D-alanine--D-alanine ligase n=1 Tax=Thiohalocapsa marina TaxID=424902 RepID=A0A5M8FP08_9GAMM|nr:D-alanine--D-alanine ligase [Thiohalocapsa marina]KAA6186224.1 D-alanine--D-alanine ligase [Thiohalocapsa marina]